MKFWHTIRIAIAVVSLVLVAAFSAAGSASAASNGHCIVNPYTGTSACAAKKPDQNTKMRRATKQNDTQSQTHCFNPYTHVRISCR